MSVPIETVLERCVHLGESMWITLMCSYVGNNRSHIDINNFEEISANTMQLEMFYYLLVYDQWSGDRT